ncbi:fused isobutyryl-CoA mutase/GTPase IcmF [Nannocystis radixulma]|uniref:Fused isobutyryl-CoA mutase n=1 Tax=Nannocystis radixulma TaxID=2995305 RepID=A0ABT5BC54_9BACT|nr:fused isobutyryl-CoA mutase/GTPase IcmF [Nannocystis radixulma]MDC0671698.1 methylmalonyl-CoA mutase family protein [Nannocystis radixulma]
MASVDSKQETPVNPAASDENARYVARHKIRVVTAAALFDGHDAAIGVMRRVLQAGGAEVIHLGHNRGAEEVVDAAIQEDAQAIAVSSYQGGHIEYFKYMVDLLREKGAGHITVWGGGGGVIVPREIEELHAYGVRRIFSPEDGRRHGLTGMIDMILAGADFATVPADPLAELAALCQSGALTAADHKSRLARLMTAVEAAVAAGGDDSLLRAVRADTGQARAPVLGITGTGGAGKSSLTDELLARLLRDHPDRRIAVVSVDPTRRRTGGALLGDRIRMNALRDHRVMMRSLATRAAGVELSRATDDVVRLLQRVGYDLVIVETSGIGQGDAEVTRIADLCLYVMTAEYGAPSQLEKIEMLDVAHFVAVNKFEHKGSKDALRDVRKQVRRNREIPYSVADDKLPVFGTVASRFFDRGVNGLYAALCAALSERRPDAPWVCSIPAAQRAVVSDTSDLIPPERQHYLAEIVRQVRGYKARVKRQVQLAREIGALTTAQRLLADEVDSPVFARKLEELRGQLDSDTRRALEELPKLFAAYREPEFVVKIRAATVRYPTQVQTLSGTTQPRVAVPGDDEPGALVRFGLLENLPGYFPFTAGVFPFKRDGEDPKRMFAGEGGPARTNERFHYLSSGEPAKRLSTAFDSVTLYGWDPDERPDVFGKIGESGVSICTLDDAKLLYSGFDLCDPATSVSMTINGPAPILLAFYMNTAIDQQVEREEANIGRAVTEEERAAIADRTLQVVRGTVQADILKEDQAQNTCIFSIEFALRMMGDIQQYFIQKKVRNYYSVSISGYHIAEAGANPITQLAFTLSNGFTFVEYYRARGLAVDEFAPNLSFFFSNGLDSEYTVIGRVARRIWAIAMRDLYGADERSQKLKYHIQTSGRSLHAMEIDFNDIRTTLQALFAYYDHCNSLHTNAYDEAITTPTEASVRRAMAIQLIITREQGLAKTENVLQGSYIVDELTELVEEAVLAEFLRLDERGGVLGAMERQYQRGKIQDESLLYEQRKHSGDLPIIGVNTFINPNRSGDEEAAGLNLTRASHAEKTAQIDRLRAFQARNVEAAPAALERLRHVALSGGNIFAALMETARVCSLGQISRALFEVGGEYRRSM